LVSAMPALLATEDLKSYSVEWGRPPDACPLYGTVRSGGAWSGGARWGRVGLRLFIWSGMAGSGLAGRGLVWRGRAWNELFIWRGGVWHGGVRNGQARQGRAGIELLHGEVG